MARVVRPGGTVAAYAWDMLGGGFPLEPIRIEMRAMGLTVLSPPTSEASRIEVLHDLWTRAGIDAVETSEITVQRTATVMPSSTLSDTYYLYRVRILSRPFG